MSFLTRADLEINPGTAELAQLTDRAAGAVIDDTVLAEAIATAEALIWPALHAYDRDAVAAAPDPILKAIARPLAIAALYGSRDKPEGVKADENSALKLLDRIASRAYVLSFGTPPTEADAGSVAVEIPEPVFSGASMAGY